MSLFHKDADFVAFENVLGEGLRRYPVDLLTYCLMGNHWHLVLLPHADDAWEGSWRGWASPTSGVIISTTTPAAVGTCIKAGSKVSRCSRTAIFWYYAAM